MTKLGDLFPQLQINHFVQTNCFKEINKLNKSMQLGNLFPQLKVNNLAQTNCFKEINKLNKSINTVVNSVGFQSLIGSLDEISKAIQINIATFYKRNELGFNQIQHAIEILGANNNSLLSAVTNSNYQSILPNHTPKCSSSKDVDIYDNKFSNEFIQLNYQLQSTKNEKHELIRENDKLKIEVQCLRQQIFYLKPNDDIKHISNNIKKSDNSYQPLPDDKNLKQKLLLLMDNGYIDQCSATESNSHFAETCNHCFNWIKTKTLLAYTIEKYLFANNTVKHKWLIASQHFYVNNKPFTNDQLKKSLKNGTPNGSHEIDQLFT